MAENRQNLGFRLESLSFSPKAAAMWVKKVDYEIPAEFVKGKKEVRVKFVAHKGKQVGQIYGVRLVKN